MAKPAFSSGAFRGLVAFCAAKAHHDHKHDGEYRLLKLFGSAEDVPDRPLQQWSDEAELLGLGNHRQHTGAAHPRDP